LYVYAKQLLSGTKKLFVCSQRNIKDWVSLKSALLKELGIKLSLAEDRFRCGDYSHKKKDCSVKQKCFKCDQPRNISAQCKAKTGQTESFQCVRESVSSRNV